MAVNRQTAWTDDTEVQVTQVPTLVRGVRVMKNRNQGAGEFFIGLYDSQNPDLAANDAPVMALFVPRPSLDNKFSMKYVFPGGVRFRLGLAWFAYETVSDFGDAVTGNNVPVLDLYYDVLTN